MAFRKRLLVRAVRPGKRYLLVRAVGLLLGREVGGRDQFALLERGLLFRVRLGDSVEHGLDVRSGVEGDGRVGVGRGERVRLGRVLPQVEEQRRGGVLLLFAARAPAQPRPRAPVRLVRTVPATM